MRYLLMRESQQKIHKDPVDYGELVAELGELLNEVKAGGKLRAINKLSRFSPELRQIAELINEIASCSEEQHDLQMAKLDLAIKASHVGLWDMQVVKGDPVSPNNAFTWSDEFRHMLGYSNEIDFPNVLGSWSEKLHPEDKKRTLDSFAKHLLDLSGSTPYDIEYRLLRKNGEYGYFHASGATMRDGQGNALRVVGAVWDITEAKKTEAQKESTDLRLSLLKKSINLALWDMTVDPTDPVGGNNEFWWSPEFRHLLGFSSEQDFPNVLNSWSNRLHPEDKDKTLSAFARHLTDKTGRTPYNVEYRVKRKTGEYIWLRADGSTLRGKDGTPIRVVGSVKDISDQLSKKAALGSHVAAFSQAIERMTQQIGAIITATSEVAKAQASSLSISTESEKNASETTSIISAMQNVASQTNVLGINASIEAARAGHLGKGFAVVSEEVRKLAQDSKVSADQIESKVRSVQHSTKQISDAIKETDALVNTQKDIIAKLHEDLVSVNTMYGELVKMISDSSASQS